MHGWSCTSGRAVAAGILCAIAATVTVWSGPLASASATFLTAGAGADAGARRTARPVSLTRSPAAPSGGCRSAPHRRLEALADVIWFSASWAKSQRRRSTSSSATLRLSLTRASNVDGVRTNVVGDLVGVGAERRRWEHRVHHAQSQRPRRGNLLVQEVEAPGQRGAADAGPEERAPVVAREAIGREVRGKDGVLGGEAEIACGSKAASGSDSRPTDHGDGRLGHHMQQHGGVEVVAGQVA